MKHMKMVMVFALLACVAVMFSACATCKTKKVEEEKVATTVKTTESSDIIPPNNNWVTKGYSID